MVRPNSAYGRGWRRSGDERKAAMPSSDVPQRAQVVIVGGGAVGCSVAYHLAKLGWTDVVLLEQGQLSCGTTWHAAGVVGQLRTHPSLTRLMLEAASCTRAWRREVGLGTGWNQSGALWVAASRRSHGAAAAARPTWRRPRAWRRT